MLEKEEKPVYAAEQARKIIALIEQHRSPDDPAAYAVWHAYASPGGPALKAALDDIVARKGGIDRRDVELLHKAYCAKDELAAIGASGALASEIDKIVGMIERAVAGANQYGSSLDTITGGLTHDMDSEAVRRIVQRLKDTTRHVIADNEQLNASLRQQRADMQQMRDTLRVARHEAATDALTGIANRRHFDTMIDVLVSRAQSRNSPLSLIMIDVDNFKIFNDEHGHQFGDQVLKLVAFALKQNMPEHGTAVRYGGEEFIALLPDVDIARAMRIAEMIRTAVGGKDLVKRATRAKIGRVTVSLGVAAVRASDTATTIVERADRCLIGAKTLGRDRTVCETDLPIKVPMRKAG